MTLHTDIAEAEANLREIGVHRPMPRACGLAGPKGCGKIDEATGTVRRCRHCDGSGENYRVGQMTFPNSEEGYREACWQLLADAAKDGSP